MAKDEMPDVLPIWANEILILLWLLLFGGRWLLAPVLQMAGTLSAVQLAALDEGVLLKLYLILLAITCIVVALRFVRSFQSGTQTPQTVGDGATIQARPLPVDTATGMAMEANGQGTSLNGDDNILQANGQVDTAPTGGDENL